MRKRNFFCCIIGTIIGGFILSYIDGVYPIELVMGIIAGSALALYNDYQDKEE